MNGSLGRGIGLSLMRMHELAGGDVDGLLAAARIAEDSGATEVHVSDHVALSASAHAEREGFPYPLDFPWFEPIAVLSAVAAVTLRIRLATNILVAPLRPAILLAKQLATLDSLSHGRVSIGFGAGWQRPEFAAAGIDFESRMSQLDEQLAVCRTLWSRSPAAFSGATVRFDDLVSLPFPPQGAALPISLGIALTERNLDRVVRTADGWFPPPRSGEELAADAALLRAACERVGRDPATLKITAPLTLANQALTRDQANLPDPLAQAAELFEAGADVVVAHPRPHCGSLDELPDFVAGLVAVAAKQHA